MSDYTPTTEQVRFAYIDRRDFDSQVGLGERPGDEEVGREFDRWLASVKAEAWDEGYATAQTEQFLGGEGGITFFNPYRETETP